MTRSAFYVKKLNTPLILIPDDLLRKFRIQALQDGMTYSALGVEAVQSLLKAREASQG